MMLRLSQLKDQIGTVFSGQGSFFPVHCRMNLLCGAIRDIALLNGEKDQVNAYEFEDTGVIRQKFCACAG